MDNLPKGNNSEPGDLEIVGDQTGSTEASPEQDPAEDDSWAPISKKSKKDRKKKKTAQAWTEESVEEKPEDLPTDPTEATAAAEPLQTSTSEQDTGHAVMAAHEPTTKGHTDQAEEHDLREYSNAIAVQSDEGIVEGKDIKRFADPVDRAGETTIAEEPA